ncbi:Glu-tRNA(Gln) amidotransferase subunit GatD [Candidatus Woesearchaeota archaeon]|nr:Glu-tRNA(Gln) amidotransferase subunit GatD [Candidatus Woesearchaeota archaeon]
MKPGDRVKVESKIGSFEGVLMPEENEFLVLKLNTGYNISINKKQVTKTELVEKQKEPVEKQIKTEQNKSLPTISILHTGGTIASKVDYDTGAVYNKFTPEEMLKMFPELTKIANISSKLLSNMSSDDMRFSHYNVMAKAVEEEVKKGVKGIIITHGTDTMHYTSAALSFALENCPIPVLLVGAQRSSDRGSSDAAVNLICAATFIVNTNYAGVALCMHEHSEDNHCVILSGAKCRKMHSSRRDAFQPINTTPIARIDNNTKQITILKELKKSEGKLLLKLFDEKLKIGLLKVHTNMYAEEFQTFSKFDGLVIEGTGLGHAPINEIDKFTKEHSKIFDEVKNLAKKMPVVMATQTIYGIVDMNVYTPGRRLLEIGVLGNYCDMTPETAFIKLAWLLSNHAKETKDLFNKNLRGEISESIAYETNPSISQQN